MRLKWSNLAAASESEGKETRNKLKQGRRYDLISTHERDPAALVFAGHVFEVLQSGGQ